MTRLIMQIANGTHGARLMNPEPGPAGGSAGTTGDGKPATTDAPAAGTTGDGKPATKDAPDAGTTGDWKPATTDAPDVGETGDGKPATKDAPDAGKTAKKDDGELNLLDGDGADGDGDGDGDTPPTDEQIAEWRKGVKAFDLGDGVEFDDELLETITPALMKLSGGDASRAEEIVKAYTDYALALNRKQVERDEAFNAQLVEACRERFGKDLRRTAHLADAGGKKIFGDKLWNEIRSVRQFANNPDIMERLATFGRSAASDRGVSVERGGGKNARPASLSEQLGI